MERNLEINLEDLKSLKPISNLVLVRITKFNDILERSGIKLFFDNTYERAKNAPTFAEVVAVPNELIFSRHSSGSLQWDTDMDLEVGDFVIYHYNCYVNANNLEANSGKLMKVKEEPDVEYLFVKYDQIFTALRHNKEMVYEMVKSLTEEEQEKLQITFLDDKVYDIIMCNGYLLLEGLNKEIKTDLILPDTVKAKQGSDTEFIVRATGSMIKEYMYGDEHTRHGDTDPLGYGDVIITDRNCNVPHQYELHKILNKQYFRIQRREVLGRKL